MVLVSGAIYITARDGPSRSDELIEAREGSVGTSETRRVARLPEPQAYDVTYRVEETATGDPVVNTERLQVRRPFEARTVTKSGPPPGAQVTADRTSTFGYLTLGRGTARKLLRVPPAIGSSDLRFAAVEEAVAKRHVERREQRLVSGWPCQVYRFGGTVAAGELVPVGTNRGEHADVCVDAKGLMLEELWVREGRQIRRKVAVTINDHARLADSVFSLAGIEEVTVDEGGGAVREVPPGSPTPKGLWVLDTPPAAFAHQGRYGVVLPDLDPRAVPGQREGPPSTSATDVYVRGPDVLIIDQGGGAPFKRHPYGEPIDLGAIGRGESFLDLRMNEARAVDDEGYVRVLGTLPRAELVAIARRLHRA